MIKLNLVILSLCFSFPFKGTCQFNASSMNFDDIFIQRNDKVDSLKWVIYSLNYELQAVHYRDKSQPKFGILECDSYITKIQKGKGDSLLYYFSFFKGDTSNIYVPEKNYYNGVGIDGDGAMFPITNFGIYNNKSDKGFLTSLFKDGDINFRNYLKKYKGNLCKWLSQEIKNRDVKLTE